MKIKLRDLTKEQFQKWLKGNCYGNSICAKCQFDGTDCITSEWINHKNIFNDKFLDQTVEIEASAILDKEEHDYLEAVIKPWKEKVEYIIKGEGNDKSEYIGIVTDRCGASLYFPLFPKGTMYKGMETHKHYTLEELGL